MGPVAFSLVGHGRQDIGVLPAVVQQGRRMRTSIPHHRDGGRMTLLAVAALVRAIGQEGNFHTPPIVDVAMRIDAGALLDGSA